jgi:Predicted nucleotide-binding protein containing TIR-like domain
MFVGSSREAKQIAEAIHANLQTDAECTVWTEGAFGISTPLMESLMAQVRDSDFGIFVFWADDTLMNRGELFLAPRDNVVYELGLFSGAIGPQRCFFAIPDNPTIHLPSDLLGITPGTYEASRTDQNWNAATGPFCSNVRKSISRNGLRSSSIDERLRDLAVQYECCDWIDSVDPRVARRRTIFGEMMSFCKSNPVNKTRLLQDGRTGFRVALAAAISAHPAEGDDKLILDIDPKTVPRGFAQNVTVDALLAIDAKRAFTDDERTRAIDWVDHLRDGGSSLDSKKIARLKRPRSP